MASVINQIKVGTVEYAIAASAYAECSTAGGTAAKTATICTDSDTTNTAFTLIKGVSVQVKFTANNTAANPTLNINSTGAKAIYYKGAAVTASYLKANYVYTFVYNGTQWDLVGNVENTDAYVSQQNDTSSSDLRVILSKSANDTTETGVVRKSANFTFSPSNGTVQIGEAHPEDYTEDASWDGDEYAGTGTLIVSGNIIAGAGDDGHGVFPAKYNYSTIGSADRMWYTGYISQMYATNFYEDGEALSSKYAPKVHTSSTASDYGSASASVYGHAMASGTSPKMNGTAAVGSETAKFARGDHVHPTDTSRAPKSHTSSTASTYGSASASVYGHAMASSTTPKAHGTAAVGSETAKFARGDHVHPLQTVATLYTWEEAD